MSSLSGCTALVTGAGRRLGRSLALALSEEGVHVVLHYHASSTDALEVASLIRSKGVKAWTVEGDLSDPTRASGIFDEACALAGPIDFLV
ncbi:MAG TPA: SDR family NAD(P)-dependent oxidoreductase, partial [Spirochaetia bacterium]|nr:SDR family NAD(P)-dependent oxidoreductase [Spirochaetia bacterium]